MKQYLIITLIVISTISCKGQNQTVFTYDNFENQIINYQPKQKENVSKKDFDNGVMIVNETKKAVKGNPDLFNVLDYFNILGAFLRLKENEQNIKIAYNKFEKSEGSCKYILELENYIKNNPIYRIILIDYLEDLEKCKSNIKEKKPFDIKQYCKEKNLDINLVTLINKISVNDKKYRLNKPVDWNKQKPNDLKNQQLIDSLYNKYQTYIGTSLVGKKYSSVMWVVIQHSNPKMMGKYLPIISDAVKEKELNVGALKMLIDRYYGLTYGYQVFGSQSGFGFKLADEKTRKEIEKKYEIE